METNFIDFINIEVNFNQRNTNRPLIDSPYVEFKNHYPKH
jgi:hypothetical protein